MKLDLLVRANEILTMDPDRPIATAVGVISERIVGFDEEVTDMEAERTLDFDDACITPVLSMHIATQRGGVSASMRWI